MTGALSGNTAWQTQQRALARQIQQMGAHAPAVSWGSTSASPGAYMSYSAAVGNAS